MYWFVQIRRGCIVNFNTCNVARIFSIAFIVFIDKIISSCNPHIIDLSKVEFGSHSSSLYNSSISSFRVSNCVRRWLFKFYKKLRASFSALNLILYRSSQIIGILLIPKVILCTYLHFSNMLLNFLHFFISWDFLWNSSVVRILANCICCFHIFSIQNFNLKYVLKNG